MGIHMYHCQYQKFPPGFSQRGSELCNITMPVETRKGNETLRCLSEGGIYNSFHFRNGIHVLHGTFSERQHSL
jgi:hypothetical protein